MASRGASPRQPSSSTPSSTSATAATASDPWLNHIMQIFALFMLCGIFTSVLIPETRRKTLEELSDEKDKPFFQLSFVSGFFKGSHISDAARWQWRWWRKTHSRSKIADGKSRAIEEGAREGVVTERVIVRAKEWPFLPIEETDAWRAKENR